MQLLETASPIWEQRGMADRDSVAAPPAAPTNARLIAIFGHELRNHIVSVKSAAELLEHQSPSGVTSRAPLETIHRRLDDMSRLVDDLLGVVRLQTETLLLRPTCVSIADVIEHALHATRPLVAARNHTLAVDVEREPILLRTDVKWLSQAIQNLVANAAKYTEPHGRIDIIARRDGKDIVIAVNDTGIGIAPAHLDAIFRLYVRCDGSPIAGTGGLGIGLYLVRLVVEAHGGTVHAVSEGLGRGSRFLVRLPCNLPTKDGHCS